jgi:hypothetical protein
MRNLCAGDQRLPKNDVTTDCGLRTWTDSDLWMDRHDSKAEGHPHALSSAAPIKAMLIKEGDEKDFPTSHGFPTGCFILRSVPTGRLLDVASDSVQDGAPIILWPEKDNSLVESTFSLT